MRQSASCTLDFRLGVAGNIKLPDAQFTDKSIRERLDNPFPEVSDKFRANRNKKGCLVGKYLQSSFVEKALYRL